MFLSWVGPRSVDSEIEPSLHLTIGVLGEADRAGLGDAFQSCGDIDAVAHQIAVTLFDDIPEVNANAEDDASVLRQAGVALDHGVLHFDGAAHGVDHAAEFDQSSIAGALYDTTVMHGDRRVDEIAAERPEAGKSAILVRAGEPAETDDVGSQDRRKFAGFGHRAPFCRFE